MLISEGKAVFYKSSIVGSNHEPADVVAKEIIKVIKDIGSKKIAGVATNNKSKMTAA